MHKQICAIGRLSITEHFIPMTIEGWLWEALCQSICNHFLSATRHQLDSPQAHQFSHKRVANRYMPEHISYHPLDGVGMP